MFSKNNNYVEINTLRILLENNALTNIKDKQGRTVIFNTCHKDNMDAIEVLIEYGADIHETMNDGTNLREYAQKHNAEKIIHFLNSFKPRGQ